MKLAPGLHRVGTDIVACYLVDTEEGVLLVDAGIAGQWPDLLAELAAMGRTTSDVRGIVLTHGDEDASLALAARLTAERGFPTYVPHWEETVTLDGSPPTAPPPSTME